MSKKDFQNGFALGLASGGVVEIEKEEQEKSIDITENGTTVVTPDEGMTLSGVTVNVEVASGGGGNKVDPIENKILYGSYEYENENVTIIPLNTFSGDKFLTKCSFPNVVEVGTDCFSRCSKLAEINFPKLKTSYGSSFAETNLKTVCLPSLSVVVGDMFNRCYVLEVADFLVAKQLIAYGFNRCYSLKQVILRAQSVATLANVNCFDYCYHLHGTVDASYNPNGDKDGYIYVPLALVEQYKVATNWTTFADRFRALESYTVDGTITGELDESKI